MKCECQIGLEINTSEEQRENKAECLLFGSRHEIVMRPLNIAGPLLCLGMSSHFKSDGNQVSHPNKKTDNTRFLHSQPAL